MLYDRFIVTKYPLKVRSLLLQIIASVTIWLMIFPVVLLHASLFLYQEIYFSIYGIPKARFKDYVVIDRFKLKKLNMAQRMSCAYCGYANGLAAWGKVVANRTEVYSCAIKHNTAKVGQEHQKDFLSYEDFT